MKLLLAILVALAFGGPAVAQLGCGTHAGITMRLNMQYDEVRLGMACVRAVGEGWTVDPPVPPGAPV